MAGLLVSVRSAAEARAALDGGATLIDIKEPSRGALGCADVQVWDEVREAMPAGTVLSLALGELPEWRDRVPVDVGRMSGFTYRKLGLAWTGPGWETAWSLLRQAWMGGPAWVAVAYADWQASGAPSPEAVLASAISSNECAAILVDTWDKSTRNSLDETWLPWFNRARRAGLRTAVAGKLDEDALPRLACLQPDWFAVRGAACRGGDRQAAIDAGRVNRLVQRIAQVTSTPSAAPGTDGSVRH